MSTISGLSNSFGQLQVEKPGVVGESRVAATDGFGDMIANRLRDVSRSIHQAEAAAVGGLSGNVPVQQVVEAVMSAEQNLQVAIALREKVISAYLEISRMQI